MSPVPELWLFGSAARGDTDPLSDIDLLVTGQLNAAVVEGLSFPKGQVSLVRYEWDELRHMASYGSLFLHHLREEGRPLGQTSKSELAMLLETLPPYQRADRELASFGVVLGDVEHALQGDHAPAFELSVISTALRHACILGCYAIGKPTFGRHTAFEVFLKHAGYEDLLRDAQRLYDFRLYEDQRAPAPYPASTRDVQLWLVRARYILRAVEGAIRDGG